jgi:hypothetical protein
MRESNAFRMMPAMRGVRVYGTQGPPLSLQRIFSPCSVALASERARYLVTWAISERRRAYVEKYGSTRWLRSSANQPRPRLY